MEHTLFCENLLKLIEAGISWLAFCNSGKATELRGLKLPEKLDWASGSKSTKLG